MLGRDEPFPLADATSSPRGPGCVRRGGAAPRAVVRRPLGRGQHDQRRARRWGHRRCRASGFEQRQPLRRGRPVPGCLRALPAQGRPLRRRRRVPRHPRRGTAAPVARRDEGAGEGGGRAPPRGLARRGLARRRGAHAPQGRRSLGRGEDLPRARGAARRRRLGRRAGRRGDLPPRQRHALLPGRRPAERPARRASLRPAPVRRSPSPPRDAPPAGAPDPARGAPSRRRRGSAPPAR